MGEFLNGQFSADGYYDLVAGKLKAMGYSKMPDVDTVNEDYENDISPEKSAEAFAKDWGDPGDEEID